MHEPSLAAVASILRSATAAVPRRDDVWLFDLLELAPTPDEGRRLRTKTVADLLKRHRISRISALQVVAALRERPLPVADGIVFACSSMVRILVAQAKLLHSQEAGLEREIKARPCSHAESSGR